MEKATETKVIYSAVEQEVLILKACWDAIDSMVNFNMLKLVHRDPDSEIWFKTDIHQKLFNILLVDFIKPSSEGIAGLKQTCLEGLQAVSSQLILGDDTRNISDAVKSFTEWLESDVQLEHGEEKRTFWFPSISDAVGNKEIALKISRKQFIEICGNISKHNKLGLTRQAKAIQNIFEKSGVTITSDQALLAMNEFYEQFHDDIFNYHGSAIAEFLNNIRWAIYSYLQPVRQQHVEYYWSDVHNMKAWRYKYPDKVDSPFVQSIFLDLMNDVISEPYMPQFIVGELLKRRY